MSELGPSSGVGDDSGEEEKGLVVVVVAVEEEEEKEEELVVLRNLLSGFGHGSGIGPIASNSREF